MTVSRRDLIKGTLAFGGTLLLGPISCFGGPRGTTGKASYLELEKSGELASRAKKAYAMFKRCELCPRLCRVDRTAGNLGVCRAPDSLVVNSAQPHFGEELPLVGSRGSGTIFFSNCGLRCVFCQNWPIAHEGRGRTATDEDLAAMMIRLQGLGCHNINFVTPTHVVPNILAALRIAIDRGLTIPLVYNTSGYERLEILELLDGVMDIYLPDVKYQDDEKANTYSSGAKDYPEHARKGVQEMLRQVGHLVTDENGIALRGVMIRHLVMPNDVSGTKAFMTWVAETLSPETYVNVMAQYRVEYQAYEHPEIARGVTAEEFLQAIDWAEKAGLTNMDDRSLMARDRFRRRLGG